MKVYFNPIKTNFSHNQDIKSNQNETLKNAGIIVGSGLAGDAIYGTIDYFTAHKKYVADVANEHADFSAKVKKYVEDTVNELKATGEKVDDADIEAITNQGKFNNKKAFTQNLDSLKTVRNKQLRLGLTLSALAGLLAGAVFVMSKNTSKKVKVDVKDNESLKITPVPVQEDKKEQQPRAIGIENFIKTKGVSFASKQISFGGVVDEVADFYTSSQMADLKEYIKGLNPTPDEEVMARRIAAYKLSDWPAGIERWNFMAKICPAKTSKEYHTYLLEQKIYVRPTPPHYYRNYDKLFNTQRWQDFQHWDDYIKEASKFERMLNMIERLYLKQIEDEKIAIEQAARKQLVSAYIKYQLSQNFLADFNSKNENVNLPNAIMFIGSQKKERVNNIKWLVGKTNANFIHIEHNNDSNEVKVNQLRSALESAKEYYDKNGVRTILWVDDFAKMIELGEDNEDVVADLKEILCTLNKDYQTTLVFETSDTKNLDPIALQHHRVGLKLNLDKEVKPEEFQKLQKELLKTAITEKTPYDGGYRFKYVPFAEDYVDLYLGDCGYNSDILWIETKNPDIVKIVLENADVIKSFSKFKNVKTAQFPCSSYSVPKVLKDEASFLAGRYTKNGDKILTCPIKVK